MTQIIVPFLDANIADVTVVKWLKQVGDDVERGDVICEVSTDKAAFEIEADGSGKLLAIFAPEKSVVPVKYVLAILGCDGENYEDALKQNEGVMCEYRGEVKLEMPKVSAPPGGFRATPKARRLAQANGIKLEDVYAHCGLDMITENAVKEFMERG